MIKSSREIILGALKKAFIKTRPQGQSESASAELAQMSPQESWDALEQKLQNLSAALCVSTAPEQASEFLSSIIKDQGVKTAVCWEDVFHEVPQISDILKSHGVRFRNSFESRKDYLEFASRADLGITTADGIIQESGTLILPARKGWERSTSLLPPIHLAVLRAGSRIASIRDLAAYLRTCISEQGSLPSAVQLITGPSRTADIEFNLVLGAYGPRALYILVIKE